MLDPMTSTERMELKVGLQPLENTKKVCLVGVRGSLAVGAAPLEVISLWLHLWSWIFAGIAPGVAPPMAA